MTATPTIRRAGGSKIRHYTGDRLTHVTYRGVAELTDGARVTCPHEGHRTPEAAGRCAIKAAR
jgi:hypothetical protein